MSKRRKDESVPHGDSRTERQDADLDRPCTPGTPAPLFEQGQSPRHTLPDDPNGHERQPGCDSDSDSAASDPYRSGQAPSGWTPPEHPGTYGRRGFGGTGHGAEGYAGLGAFEVSPQDGQGGDLRHTSEPRTYKADENAQGGPASQRSK